MSKHFNLGMSGRKLIWLGFGVGSSVGGLVPTMWGNDMLSVSGILLSLVGGVVGFWAGYRASKLL